MSLDILLIILGIIFLIVGFIGCIVPILPGPPISYLALLMLHFTHAHQFGSRFLWTWAIIVIVVTILDNLTPVWGTKKFGGSRRGTWGATIGLLIGILFFPPIGIILGPFAGAVIGELTHSEDFHQAIKSGLGSLLGFLIGTGLKMGVTGFIIYYFFKELF
jgi:uncharacterized protein YqgC (DUF456 family)